MKNHKKRQKEFFYKKVVHAWLLKIYWKQRQIFIIYQHLSLVIPF
jgi:hypothetical protein